MNKGHQSIALLKILNQSRKSMEEGKVKPVKKAFSDMRKNLKGRA